MVQWLRLHTPNTGGMGSIPGQGTKILHAAAKKLKKQNKTKYTSPQGNSGQETNQPYQYLQC